MARNASKWRGSGTRLSGPVNSRPLGLQGPLKALSEHCQEREYAAEVLQRDIARAQEHLWRTQMQTSSVYEEMEAERGGYELEEAEAKLAKQCLGASSKRYDFSLDLSNRL